MSCQGGEGTITSLLKPKKKKGRNGFSYEQLLGMLRPLIRKGGRRKGKKTQTSNTFPLKGRRRKSSGAMSSTIISSRRWEKKRKKRRVILNGREKKKKRRGEGKKTFTARVFKVSEYVFSSKEKKKGNTSSC